MEQCTHWGTWHNRLESPSIILRGWVKYHLYLPFSYALGICIWPLLEMEQVELDGSLVWTNTTTPVFVSMSPYPPLKGRCSPPPGAVMLRITVSNCLLLFCSSVKWVTDWWYVLGLIWFGGFLDRCSVNRVMHGTCTNSHKAKEKNQKELNSYYDVKNKYIQEAPHALLCKMNYTS